MNFPDIESLARQKAQALFPNSPVDQAHFLALIQQESGFNPSAENRTPGEGGGQGLFQFGKELRARYGVDKTSDPAKQFDAGADYIRELHAKHHGDWNQIAGEYNLGLPTWERYKRGIKNAVTDRFESQYLPRHTSRANTFGASTMMEANPQQAIEASVTPKYEIPKARTPPIDPAPQANPTWESRIEAMAPEERQKAGFTMGLLLGNIFHP